MVVMIHVGLSCLKAALNQKGLRLATRNAINSKFVLESSPESEGIRSVLFGLDFLRIKNRSYNKFVRHDRCLNNGCNDFLVDDCSGVIIKKCLTG